MSQRQYLLDKFRIHGGILTTGDLIKDMKTAAEYRRLLCELRANGYVIEKTRLKDNLFQYRLSEPDANGQFSLAI